MSMEQVATVIRLVDAGNAEVEVMRRGACASDCDSCGGCPNAGRAVRAVVRNDVRACPGDTVIVTSATGRIFSLAALVYVLPVLLMLLLASLPSDEGQRILAGLCGLALGVGASVWQSRRMTRRGERVTSIVRVVAGAEEETV